MKSDFSLKQNHLLKALCRLVTLENRGYWLFIFIGLIYSWGATAQNLVPNPSFETYVQCPPYPGQIQEALNWDSPNNNTTDYFHLCSPKENGAGIPENLLGNQLPSDGIAYVGIRTWIPVIPGNPVYREYLSVQLLEPLVEGIEYAVQFKVSLAETSSHASDDLGVYFSKTPLKNERLYEVIPQIQNENGRIIKDQKNWVTISNTFIAEGGEQFMVVGTFKNDEQMTREVVGENEEPKVYYYIDEMRVESCTIPPILRADIDTTLCSTNQLEITAVPDALSYTWNDAITQESRFISQAGTYTVVSELACYDFTTSYQVEEEDCSCLPKMPSPQLLKTLLFEGRLQLLENPTFEWQHLSLFDMMGRQIAHIPAMQINDFDTYRLASGTYFYQIAYSCQGPFGISSTAILSGKLLLLR